MTDNITKQKTEILKNEEEKTVTPPALEDVIKQLDKISELRITWKQETHGAVMAALQKQIEAETPLKEVDVSHVEIVDKTDGKAVSIPVQMGKIKIKRYNTPQTPDTLWLSCDSTKTLVSNLVEKYFSRLSVPIDVLHAFRVEYYNVLNDGGEQTSLFDADGAHGITEEQRALWTNYLEMKPHERRYWLLRLAAYVLMLGEVLSQLLPQEGIAKPINLEFFGTRFPTDYPLPLAKPVNPTFSGILNEIPQFLRLEGRKGKEITAVATLVKDKEKAPALDGLRGLDWYDKQVHNAIVALFAAQGDKECVITPQMIYRTILADKNARLSYGSPDHIRIVNSMKKLFGYILDIDTGNKDKNGNPKYTKLMPRRYFGPLLMGEYFEAGKVRLNGQEVTGFFKIYRQPILDVLACEINQRTIIPAALLKLPEKSATEYAIILKGEIAERIAWVKNAKARKKRVSCKIKYSELYAKVGITGECTPANMKKRQKAREITKKILEQHIKEKNIKGYIEIKGHGRAIEGIEIEF